MFVQYDLFLQIFENKTGKNISGQLHSGLLALVPA